MLDRRSLIEDRRDGLRESMIELGERVAGMVVEGLEVLRTRDLERARSLVAADQDINGARRALEQEALLILAAHRPAGRDLRLVGVSLEMVSELERIADHAADLGRLLLRHPDWNPDSRAFISLLRLGEGSRRWLDGVLNGYSHGTEKAILSASGKADFATDRDLESINDDIIAALRSDPASAADQVALLWMSQHLERIAERATNIAGQLAYIETGNLEVLD
ncbi:phosphate transport system regulatory protein PhoU [Marichromatium gracile]|uniref:phosphate signaling complex PhoU family protein n=1 Tax=Marichromatium gracile TaxID=1048 RepID=UPI001F48CB55|nr:PhoU domain-containing protein [Marichromatium gracile]MCF1184805.1 phosphate transport system regulatory protein PhoU [Marichromatium gracile]